MADCFIGEIRIFGGNYPPQGWMLCNGQILQIQYNDVLYSLLGTTYGGDGQTTFALPDLQGRLPIHRSATHPMAQKGGTETVVLDQTQLPAHSHLAQAYSEPGNQTTPAGGVWASSQAQFTDIAPNGAMNALAIQAVGGGQGHNNLMPFLPLTFIIAVEGTYPVQS